MDQSRPNRQQGAASQSAVPVGAPRQGNVPALERGIISGDNIQFRRLRDRTRLSQSESSGDEWLSSSVEAGCSYGQSPVLQGMQAEHTWRNRGSYEDTEGNFHRRLASNGNRPLSSSPRSPNTKGSFTAHPRRTHGQQQDQGHTVTTVKASGTPHRQLSKGRNRTSSETEQGGKGSRGPHQRKRGLSETENKPKWDKYDIPHIGNGRDVRFMLLWLFCICCLHSCLALVILIYSSGDVKWGEILSIYSLLCIISTYSDMYNKVGLCCRLRGGGCGQAGRHPPFVS